MQITLPSVALGTPDECHNGGHMVTLSSSTGYLSSLITEETGVGTSGCPWKIKAGKGQQVALAVFDFNLFSNISGRHDYYGQDEYSSGCPISIVVEDQDIRKEITLCSEGWRQRHVFTSTGNEVTVHFAIRKMPDIHYYFLVQYQGENHSYYLKTGHDTHTVYTNTPSCPPSSQKRT